MRGLLACHRRMEMGRVPPVVHAAVVSYGFVFLHPFLDGNGRIHRFLIHNILARRGFTPPGAIFPVSAAMLNRPKEYDESLEAFSRRNTTNRWKRFPRRCWRWSATRWTPRGR